MTLTDRDKRALAVLGVALVVSLAVYFWPQSGQTTEVVEAAASVEAAEKRLEQVRRLAAQLPAREKQLEAWRQELARWEAGLIRAETGQQAQAEVVQILREIASRQAPPLEFASVDIGTIRALDQEKRYGEALVSVTFDCPIEQLINLLADLEARPEAVVTDELRLSVAKRDRKLLHVRLRVAGLVPGSLIPERKGVGAF